MKRMLSLAALIVVLVLFSSCSDKKAPGQELAKSRDVLSVLRSLNKSYDAKNLNAFMDDVSGAYKGRDAFSKSLGAVFTRYKTVHLSINYSKMIILMDQAGQIKPTFTCEAEWVAADGASQKDGARVTLVFEPKDYKLVSIDGKNPFVPQPGQTPGK